MIIMNLWQFVDYTKELNWNALYLTASLKLGHAQNSDTAG